MDYVTAGSARKETVRIYGSLSEQMAKAIQARQTPANDNVVTALNVLSPVIELSKVARDGQR